MPHHVMNDNGHVDLTDLDDRCQVHLVSPYPPTWFVWALLALAGLVLGSAGYGLVLGLAWLARRLG